MLKRHRTFSKNINLYMNDQVNLFLQIRDPQLKKEFDEFSDSHKTEVSSFSLFAFIFVSTVPCIVWMIFFLLTKNVSQRQKSLAGGTTVSLVIIAVLFYYAYLPSSNKMLPNTTNHDGDGLSFQQKSTSTLPPQQRYNLVNTLKTYFHNHKSIFQKIFYLLFIGFYAFRLISRVVSGQCHSTNFAAQYDCNPNAIVNGLPQDAFLAVGVFPLAITFVTREKNFLVKSAAAVIILGSLTFSASYVGIDSSTSIIATFLFAIIIFMYDSQYHNLTMFFMYKHLQQTILENEKRADEQHLNELRHMIGNVAHDLKTPLSAFVSGIEFIHLVIGDLQRKLSEEHITEREFVNTSVFSIMDCMRNIRNTHSFMLMTINRCIDFTKASKGLKLAPKYDTIDIMDALKLPISCVQDVQSQVEIELLEIPRNLCHYLITDKQWLQENLLCLLSNAVKYSVDGKVQVRISLETYKSEDLLASSSNADEDLFRMTTKQRSMTEKNNLRSNQNSSMLSLFRTTFLSKSAVTAGPARRNSKLKVYSVGVKVGTEEDGEYAPELAATMEQEDSIIAGNRKSTSVAIDGGYKKKESRSNSTSSSHSTAVYRYPHGSTSVYNLHQHREQHLTNVYIRFEVMDEGVGISDEMIGSLFSPFKQAQRLTGGTGLGLYSLAKRVEALNGHYGVMHRNDGASGCIFWFDIPYRPDFDYELHIHSLASTSSAFHTTSYATAHRNLHPAIPTPSPNTSMYQSHSRSLSHATNTFPRYSQDPSDIVAEGSNENNNSERELSADEGWIGLRHSYSFLSDRFTANSPSNKNFVGRSSDSSTSNISDKVLQFKGSSSKLIQHDKNFTESKLILSRDEIPANAEFIEQENLVEDYLAPLPFTSSRTSSNSKIHADSSSFSNKVAHKSNFKPEEKEVKSEFQPRAVLSNAIHPASAAMINSMMMISVPYDASSTKKLNILVVDDSPTILKMTTLMFQRLGHQITTAVHGADALQKIFTRIEKYQSMLQEAQINASREENDDLQSVTSSCTALAPTIPSPNGILFDVILMDLQMPIMDGIEATRRLRQYEQAINPVNSKSSFSLTSSSKNGTLRRLISQLSGIPLSENTVSLGAPSGESIAASSSIVDGVSNNFPLVSSSNSSVVGSPTNKKALSRFANTRMSIRNSFFNDLGHSIRRHVKGQVPLHHMIIGVSANSDHDTMEDAYCAGIDAFIPKPFSLDAFYDTYDRILAQQLIEANQNNNSNFADEVARSQTPLSPTMRSSIKNSFLNTVLSRSNSSCGQNNTTFLNSMTRGLSSNLLRMNSFEESTSHKDDT